MKISFELDLAPEFNGEEDKLTPQQAKIMQANIATLITLGTAYLGTSQGMAGFREWTIHQAQCADPEHGHQLSTAADVIRVVKTVLKVRPSQMAQISDLFDPLVRQLWAEVYPGDETQAQPEHNASGS